MFSKTKRVAGNKEKILRSGSRTTLEQSELTEGTARNMMAAGFESVTLPIVKTFLPRAGVAQW